MCSSQGYLDAVPSLEGGSRAFGGFGLRSLLIAVLDLRRCRQALMCLCDEFTWVFPCVGENLESCSKGSYFGATSEIFRLDPRKAPRVVVPVAGERHTAITGRGSLPCASAWIEAQSPKWLRNSKPPET